MSSLLIEYTSKWCYRPWGKFLVVHTAPGVWVKTLRVKPHARLSLQVHQERTEIWHSPEGSLLATIGEEEFYLFSDRLYTVPPKTPHRLHNPTSRELGVTEVALGNPHEDDIIRLDDDYGRKS